jgi:hypothetical protein
MLFIPPSSARFICKYHHKYTSKLSNFDTGKREGYNNKTEWDDCKKKNVGKILETWKKKDETSIERGKTEMKDI